MSVYLDLKRNGIVAVLRHARIQTIVSIVQTLKEAGVTVLEVTMETPMALRIIEKLCTEFADHMTIGAGTVLDTETARAAILAGAKFVVSPTVNIETIRTVKRYGVLCVPGAMTPSEILTAYECGADIVKVFPANVLGPAYIIKAIAGPFPHIPLLATGGINLDNVEDYIKAGAVAVGLGNSLLNPSKEMTNKELIKLKETARRFVEKVRNAKQLLIDRTLG
jgi:2-dehydro-3-deoxyphosphogluconate aldolase / (4S)-4-hydroxy-2-oxoglutarate aldolase